MEGPLVNRSGRAVPIQFLVELGTHVERQPVCPGLLSSACGSPTPAQGGAGGRVRRLLPEKSAGFGRVPAQSRGGALPLRRHY